MDDFMDDCKEDFNLCDYHDYLASKHSVLQDPAEAVWSLCEELYGHGRPSEEIVDAAMGALCKHFGIPIEKIDDRPNLLKPQDNKAMKEFSDWSAVQRVDCYGYDGE